MAVGRLLLFILPLSLDTLGIAISLGIKSHRSVSEPQARAFPLWLRSALLFSGAEMLMPLLGIALGYAVSLVLSTAMHIVGPMLLIAVGVWELVAETRERFQKREERASGEHADHADKGKLLARKREQAAWLRQLVLVLSISLDELIVGFSLGGLTGSIGGGQVVNPLVFCALVGIQSFLITIIGLTAGRLLRMRLKPVQEWSEILSALLLIGLGVWLFFIG